MRASRRLCEEAVSPVIAIILMVAITVVLAGVLYVWVSSLADTGRDVEHQTFYVKIYVGDNETHVGVKVARGDDVEWAMVRLLCNGIELHTNENVTSVGDTARFPYPGDDIEIGNKYPVIIVDRSNQEESIVFDDDVRALEAD